MKTNILLVAAMLIFTAISVQGCMHICADYEAGKGKPTVSGSITTPNPPITVTVGASTRPQ